MNEVTIIGIDLAKQASFLTAWFPCRWLSGFSQTTDAEEAVAVSQEQLLCLVAMEACGGSHQWVRNIRLLNHWVRLLVLHSMWAVCQTAEE